MAELFRTHRRVEFADTDAAGMIHFSSYFLYMEQAEHALLRHVGTSVINSDATGTISWPRVAARCDYARPVQFEDELEIEVSILRLGTKSVTYQFLFQHDGQSIAQGEITTVCCRINHDQPPQSIPIPDSLVELLQPYLQTQSNQ